RSERRRNDQRNRGHQEPQWSAGYRLRRIAVLLNLTNLIKGRVTAGTAERVHRQRARWDRRHPFDLESRRFPYRTIVDSTARAREFPQTLLRRSLLRFRAAIRATTKGETLRKADMPGKAPPASTRNSAR